MVPHELSKSDIVKIIDQLNMLLPSNFVNKQGRGGFHIAESLSCEAPMRALKQTGTELHGCSEHEAETGC